jgi:urease accessory protein
MALIKGSLRLGFESEIAAGQTRHTILKACEQQQPLKVIRAFPINHGGALVHLHNVSGGVLGGDNLEIAVEVGPQAYVQLTSTSATRLYRTRPRQANAIQTTQVQVADNGLLEYLPDQLIPFAGSRYQQYTSIELGSSEAGVFWWEIVAPGRTASGELFQYDLMQLSLEIKVQNRPIALEQLKLEPASYTLNSGARLGHFSYFATFYICKTGLTSSQWRSLEAQLQELCQKMSQPSLILWGVSTLVAEGLVVRALATNGRSINTGLVELWKTAKQELYGQPAILPRKNLQIGLARS